MYIDARIKKMLKPQLWGLAAAVGTGFAAGLASIAIAVVVARVIAAVFLQGAELSQIQPQLLVLLGFGVLRAGLQWLSEQAAGRVAGAVKVTLRQALAQKILRLGPIGISAWPAGELTALINEGVESLDAYLRRYLPQLSLAALVPLAIATYVLVQDPLSGLVLLVTAPLIPLFMVLIGRLAKARSEAQWQRLQRMSGHFLDRVQGLVALRTLGRGAQQAQEIHAVSLDLARATMAVLQVAFLSALVLELLSTLSTAVVAVEIGLRVLYSRLDFVHALTVLLLAPEFYLPLRLLGARFHDGSNGLAAAQKIFALLETPELAPPRAGQKPAPRQAMSINFAQVSFRYPRRVNVHEGPAALAPPRQSLVGTPLPSSASPRGHHEPSAKAVDGEFPGRERLARRHDALSTQHRDVPEQSAAPVAEPDDLSKAALHQVSLDIGAGQTLALVGASGSGKSTLAALLLGFAEPTTGRILVNQEDLRDIDRQDWRDQIAWVSERPHLFAGSVEDNIRLARPDIDHAQVVAAAKKAQLHELIETLPQGYESQLGEGGMRLSGGQAQRLALARAFVQDAPLVVLDEISAQLDPEIEARLTTEIFDWLRGRTALIIAHRLSTVRQADQIAVLRDGQVIEQGCHDSLLKAQGLYAQMLALPRDQG